MTLSKILLVSTRSNFAVRTLSTRSTTPLLAMTPGTPIEGLDFLKNVDQVVSKERSEYPEWMGNLGTPMTSLAKLKKMNILEAPESEHMRYLKLKRRKSIKENNIDAGLR